MTSTDERTGRIVAAQSSDSSTSDHTVSSTTIPAASPVSPSPVSSAGCADTTSRITAIEQCVEHELSRYFDMLDGEEPAHLYRMVMKQAENAVIRKVMTECRGNQTRASLWLGISRGNLRTKLANMEN